MFTVILVDKCWVKRHMTAVTIYVEQVVVMLMTLLVVFALCWLPFQIVILYSEYRRDPTQVWRHSIPQPFSINFYKSSIEEFPMCYVWSIVT